MHDLRTCGCLVTEYHDSYVLTGVYEDIVFHAVMTIDEHYPKSRPSMKIAHFIKHHHVLDQEVG